MVKKWLKKWGAFIFFGLAIFGITAFTAGVFLGAYIVHSTNEPVVLRVSEDYITESEISHFLEKQFPSVKTEFLDRHYFLPAMPEVEDFLRRDNLDRLSYAPETFDCDDFAASLKARASERGIKLGIATVRVDGVICHDLNFFIVKENKKIVSEEGGEVKKFLISGNGVVELSSLKIYFINAQTDEIYEQEERQVLKTRY